MTIAPLTSSTLLLGTAWTGTAPGTGTTPSGTINSGSGTYIDITRDRKSTRLNSSHIPLSRMPSSA